MAPHLAITFTAKCSMGCGLLQYPHTKTQKRSSKLKKPLKPLSHLAFVTCWPLLFFYLKSNQSKLNAQMFATVCEGGTD
jgi:hypothetical protein